MANERLALQALDEMFIEVFERRFPKQQLTPKDHALLEKALKFYEGFASQNEHGGWCDEQWTGTGFPAVFYLRYHYYDRYFPLQALAEYRRALERSGSIPA